MGIMAQRYHDAFTRLLEAWGTIRDLAGEISQEVGEETVAGIFQTEEGFVSNLLGNRAPLKELQVRMDAMLADQGAQVNALEMEVEEKRGALNKLVDRYEELQGRYRRIKEIYHDLFGQETTLSPEIEEAISATCAPGEGVCTKKSTVPSFSQNEEDLADTSPAFPEDWSNVLEEATHAYNAGDFERAEMAYRRYLQLVPDSAEAHLKLGCLYRSQRRYELSTKFFKKALELDEKDVQTYMNLAINYCIRNQWVSAEFALQRVLDRDSENHNAVSLLESVRRKLAETKVSLATVGEMQRAS